MVTRPNHSWHLSTFLDALIYELDRAQDTLSVKGANRKLTYMVRDMALDLQLFPEYQSGHIKFTTAKPGEAGASKMTFKVKENFDTAGNVRAINYRATVDGNWILIHKQILTDHRFRNFRRSKPKLSWPFYRPTTHMKPTWRR